MHFVPGGKRLILLIAPVALALAGVAGSPVDRASTAVSAPPPSQVIDPAINVPPTPGLLVDVIAYVLSRIPAAAVAIPTFPAWAGLAYFSASVPPWPMRTAVAAAAPWRSPPP